MFSTPVAKLVSTDRDNFYNKLFKGIVYGNCNSISCTREHNESVLAKELAPVEVRAK
jgi:hypothetical protein